MKAGGCPPIVRRTGVIVCALALFGSLASESLAQPGRGGRGRGFGQPLGQGSPPAPVPEAVAIPRPTEAEIEQARQLLARLKETNAQANALLEKFPDLIAVQPPRDNTAIVPSLARFFEAKHNANLEVAKAGDIDVLFMGDSITDFWRNTDGPFAGKPVLDELLDDVGRPLIHRSGPSCRGSARDARSRSTRPGAAGGRSGDRSASRSSCRTRRPPCGTPRGAPG